MRFASLALFVGLITPMAHASLYLSKNGIGFGPTEVGTYGSTDYVYISNNGSSTVQMSVYDGCMLDFHTFNMCQPSLRPGETCSISVQFTPSSEGYHSCTVAVSTTEGERHSISVTGQAVARGN